jgi:hypothetical protein
MRALILELIQTLPGVQLSGFERGRRRLSQALYAGTIDFAVLSGDLVLEAMADAPRDVETFLDLAMIFERLSEHFAGAEARPHSL